MVSFAHWATCSHEYQIVIYMILKAMVSLVFLVIIPFFFFKLFINRGGRKTKASLWHMRCQGLNSGLHARDSSALFTASPSWSHCNLFIYLFILGLFANERGRERAPELHSSTWSWAWDFRLQNPRLCPLRDSHYALIWQVTCWAFSWRMKHLTRYFFLLLSESLIEVPLIVHDMTSVKSSYVSEVIKKMSYSWVVWIQSERFLYV